MSSWNKGTLSRMAAMLLIGSAVVAAAQPARAFDEDHKVSINGTKLHFRVRGADKANPYLLLLHGGPGFSAHMFYAWGPSLEKTLNVVYLDQRGSGESARYTIADPLAPKPDEVKGYTIENLVKDLEGVRQTLKIAKWYVLGHSWGGMLGLEYVSAHPEHVLGYIHMDGLLSVPMMEDAVLDNAEAKFRQDARSDDASRKARVEERLNNVRFLRGLPLGDPQRLRGAFGLALGPAALYFAKDQSAAFLAFNQKIQAATRSYNLAPATFFAGEPAVALIVNDHFQTRDDRPLLARITAPTLILNGKQDGVIPPKMAEIAHNGIKGSELTLLDDCGHFPFAEQPEKTTTAVLEFIKAHSR